MTGFLIVFAVALAAILGLGFYYEWFLLPWERAGNRPEITFTVHPGTLHDDEEPAPDLLHTEGALVVK